MSPQTHKADTNDVSQPRADGDYAYRREFYQSSDVAAAYDERRWGSPKRVRRNRHKWATILKALARTEDVHSVLDMPCGTGRFTGHLAREGFDVIGSDISLDMMQVAKANLAGDERIHGYVQADAEKLPLIDDAIDCIVSIRFFLHVDGPSRIRILHEMGRISRRWLIVDYRHCYSLRYLKWKIKRALGLTRDPLERVSKSIMLSELEQAGLKLVQIFPVARLFSDKWIVLAETGAQSA